MQRVLKVSLCGANAVGKSSIGCRLANQELDLDHIATIGVDYFARRLPAYNAKIGIWDLAGNIRFESITLPYIGCANTIVYVYDVTRYQTVRDIRRLHKIHCGIRDISQVRLLVVGNKKDIENSYNTCLTEGQAFASELEAPHVAVSAKENQGIDELLSTMLTEMELEKVNLKPKTDDKGVRMCDNCILS